MGRFIVDDGSAGITQSKLGLTVFGGLSTQGGLSATCADDENIYLNGNVGIGTTTPDAKLEVEAETFTSNLGARLHATGTDSVISLSLKNDAVDWHVQCDGSQSDAFQIRNDSTGLEPLTILPAGNVGIGTTSPAKLLDISGDTASMRFTETGTGARTWEVGSGVASNGAFTIYDVTGGGGRLTVNTTGAIGWGDSAGSGNLSYGDDKANVYATTDKRLHFGASNSDTHLIIETNGNIGIGTQHASRALDIGPKTDGMVIPIGSTAQRPATYLSAGTIRFNSELAAFEGYTGSAWGALGGGNAFDGASIIRYNTQTLAENVTIGIPNSLSANGFTAGPITINDGYTVTIEHGSNWTIF